MLGFLSRRRYTRSRFRMVFAVLGPGIIAATADNDATGIFGYSLAGARYQYSLLWVLVLCTIALAVCQEMGARMGAVTGKGLADLIREEYGVRVTLLAMAALLVANFATTVAEFAGILVAVRAFTGAGGGAAARFVAVPAAAIVVWLMVVRGTYRGLERILLAASLVYLLYVVSALLARPPWGVVLRQSLVPTLPHGAALRDYVFVMINMIGTTITPWGQFYVQSSVRDKGVRPEQYSLTRLDVFLGACFTTGIAFFIVVCCGATLFVAGHHRLADAGEAARALVPLAGPMAGLLFALGLFNASCFGAIAVPLSTAYAVTESLGWESGVGRRTRDAPLFVGVFTFLVFVSAIVVMAFPHHLTALIILPNIVGGMLLPIVLVLMLRLVNRPRLMGGYTNSPAYNAVAWATTATLIGLSTTLVVAGLVGAA